MITWKTGKRKPLKRGFLLFCLCRVAVVVSDFFRNFAQLESGECQRAAYLVVNAACLCDKCGVNACQVFDLLFAFAAKCRQCIVSGLFRSEYSLHVIGETRKSAIAKFDSVAVNVKTVCNLICAVVVVVTFFYGVDFVSGALGAESRVHVVQPLVSLIGDGVIVMHG